MPISSIDFKNFKVFREAKLPLGRTTLIIGPNGSGKSTCMEALKIAANATLRNRQGFYAAGYRSLGVPPDAEVRLDINWPGPFRTSLTFKDNVPPEVGGEDRRLRDANISVFLFDPEKIAQSVPLKRTLQMGETGVSVPSVLTTLQDHHPEHFEELNRVLAGWLPEFDRILLDTPEQNLRGFMLRTKQGKHPVPAAALSHGTLFAVALLTVCHLPEPPTLIGIEDPDHGMHPRLLRDVMDAIQRLSHPEEFGDNRQPVQVVMTTHSPYFLDLFHDRLEDVVIVEKKGLWSSIKRISEIPNVQDILHDAHLGETWFNGVLGGVSVPT